MARSTSRKRKAQDLDSSDQEHSDVAPRKRKSNTTGKSSNTNREANKLYKDTIKAIDAATDKLDRQVKSIKHENRWSITTETYAEGIRTGSTFPLRGNLKTWISCSISIW